ncbi:MAG: hypothetical protein ACM3WV_03825 [Bacillota bacterium]
MRNTDWFVIILGLVVSVIGYIYLPASWAWFILGFGAAHVFLGLIDLLFHRDLKEPA